MPEQILIPDIGDYKAVDVIEVAVAVGDSINAEDTLVTLETDKATMDIPAPFAGTITEMVLKVGDKVSQGSLVCQVDTIASAATSSTSAAPNTPPAEAQAAPSASTTTQPLVIPDIGTDGAVEVIELMIKPGDSVAKEDPILTLESDKASMEVPAPAAGEVVSVSVAIGDKVKQGDSIGQLQVTAGIEMSEVAMVKAATSPPVAAVADASATPRRAPAPGGKRPFYAGPGVRRFAREMGVDLKLVTGTGPRARIVKADVKAYVSAALSGGGATQMGGSGLPVMPAVDFSQFGPVERQPLSRIKKLSGKFLHRNWVLVPHVTQHDEADITELEAFRKGQKKLVEKQGVKLTPLVFLIKAVVAALKAFPHFNASLDPSGEQLVLKQYFHIGVAVDTPDGLVVPVVKNADQCGLIELAQQLATLSQKARAGQLGAKDMQGGCFTISSLGGIGGTAFTPIVNAPEVAILGISKSRLQPVFENDAFVPRLMLPLALSYDHRVIDGADAARFTTFLVQQLSDIRRLLL